MSATLPSQSIFCADSSGRAVAQSTTVWMPTSAAGMEVGSFKSTCNSKSGLQNLYELCWTETARMVCTCTVVAPQSRKKSAGVCRGLTVQRTSYPASSAFLTTCLPRVPVLPTTSMLSFGTGVPCAAACTCNRHPLCCL